jgi:hypothetical protein
MRAYLLTGLSACLGFVIGFTLCCVLFVPATNQPSLLGSTPTQKKPHLFTIVHPTFPPQIVGTFDPLQKVAEEMGLTNR